MSNGKMNHLIYCIKNDTMYYHQNINGSAYVLWKRLTSKKMMTLKRIYICVKRKQYSDIMDEACYSGDLSLIIDCITSFNITLSLQHIIAACYGSRGKLSVVKWCTSMLNCHPCVSNNLIFRMISLQGYLQVLKWLYSIGCDPTVDNHAISLAAGRGHLHIVRWLYKIGSDPTANNNDAIRTATIYGSMNGRFEVIQWLCSVGCNPMQENNILMFEFDKSAIQSAFKRGYSKILDLFTSLGYPDPRK